MSQYLVHVRVAVRLSSRAVRGSVRVAVFIMDVAVYMLRRLVFVPLRTLQADADAHECSRLTPPKRISAYFPHVLERPSHVLTLVHLGGCGRFSGGFLASACQVRRLGPKARRILL